MWFPRPVPKPPGQCQCACGCKAPYEKDWGIVGEGVHTRTICRPCFTEMEESGELLG